MSILISSSYPEAAKAYKDAIDLQQPPKQLPLGKLLGGISTRSIGASPTVRGNGDWHAYLATAMLGQENSTGAEIELRRALAIDRHNAAWRAQLGYTLATERRYTEAAALLATAFQLDEKNQAYKDLLEKLRLLANSASAGDARLAQELDGSTWDITFLATKVLKGSCQLRSSGLLRCQTNDPKEMLYEGLRWQIRDGLFALEQVSNPMPPIVPGLAEPICVGEIRSDRLDLKCVAADTVNNQLWTRHARD